MPVKRLFIVLLLVLLVAASAPAAFADEGNDTTTINMSYLGQTVIGTFVEHYSCTRHGNSPSVDINNETWTFTGQVNGQPASASGKWEGVWDGKAYIGRVTEIDTWSMGTFNEVSIGGRVIYPGGLLIGKPRKLPINMSIRSGDTYADYSFSNLGDLPALSIPLAVTGYAGNGGQVPDPCEGSRTFSATNVAGVRYQQALPRTGEEPLWPGLAALACVVLGAAALYGSRRLLRQAAT